MPRLPTYTAEVVGVGGVETRRAKGSAAAAAIGELGATALSAGEAMLTSIENEEQRRVITGNVQNRAVYDKRLQDAVISGEDVDKIKEEFDGAQSKLYDDIQTTKGRNAADYYTAESGRLFEAKTGAVKLERAVAEAKLNGSKFLMGMADILRTTPGYLPQAEKDIDNFVATLSGVRPEDRAHYAFEMRTNANLVAAMAQARLNPDAAQRDINNGTYKIDSKQAEQVINEIERTRSAQRTDSEYKYRIKEREKRELSEAAFGEHLQKIFKGNYSDQAAIADVRFEPQMLEHVQVFAKSWLREQREGMNRSDPRVLKDLWYGIHAPVGDPRRFTDIFPVIKAVRDGQVNTSDGNMLMGLVEQQKDENARPISAKILSNVRMLESSLGRNPKYQTEPGSMALADIMMQYQADIYRKVSEIRNTEGGDVHEIFNPASKHYVGSESFIQGVITSSADRRREIQNAAMPNEMTLPNGKKIRWTGKGNKQDMGTWEEVK